MKLGLVTDFNTYKEYFERYGGDAPLEIHLLESDLKMPYFEQKLIELRQFVLSRGISKISFHSVDRIMQSVLFEEKGHEADLEKYNLLLNGIKSFSNEIKQDVFLVTHQGAKYAKDCVDAGTIKQLRSSLSIKAKSSYAKLCKSVEDSFVRIALENSPPTCGAKPEDHVFDVCFEDFKERMVEGCAFVLDVCHAQMAVEYFKQSEVKFPAMEALRGEDGLPPYSLRSLENYVEVAGKFTEWLHISDCDGFLGENEGKVIGTGVINWQKLNKSIKKHVKDPVGVLELVGGHDDYYLIAESKKKFEDFTQFRIKDKLVGEGRCFMVAEIASSHCGSKEKLKTIFRESVLANADGVKFQIFDAEALCSRQHPMFNDLYGNQFSKEDWLEILEYTKQFNTIVMADVFDEGSADLCEPYVDCYSIHATDISNPFLLRHVAKKGKPMMLYIGGSTLDEVRSAIAVVEEFGNDIILVYGLQNFPTDINNVHLNRIKTLKKEFDLPICYHDHTDAEISLARNIPVHAFAFGAVMVEKHITDDRSLKGFDYMSSLNPHEFKDVVAAVREFEAMLGNGEFKLLDADMLYRKKMKKFVVAKRDIAAGEVFTSENVTFKRVSNGMFHPSEVDKVLGRKAKVGITVDYPIRNEDVVRKTIILVPVRMKSQRLKRKALLDLAGDTTIGQQLERLRTCKSGEVILCTSTLAEDAILLEEAKKRGIKAYAGDPDDVMKRFALVAEAENAELIVRATGDNPVMCPDLIDRMVEYHIKNNADYTTIEEVPIGFNPEVFSFDVMKRARKLVRNPIDTEYMTWFIKDPKHFKVQVLPVNDDEKGDFRLTLDTPADLEAIRGLFAGIHKEGHVFTCKEAVAFLKSHPEIANLNKNYKQVRLPPKLEEIKL